LGGIDTQLSEQASQFAKFGLNCRRLLGRGRFLATRWTSRSTRFGHRRGRGGLAAAERRLTDRLLFEVG
jgi:hypothetical protein